MAWCQLTHNYSENTSKHAWQYQTERFHSNRNSHGVTCGWLLGRQWLPIATDSSLSFTALFTSPSLSQHMDKCLRAEDKQTKLSIGNQFIAYTVVNCSSISPDPCSIEYKLSHPLPNQDGLLGDFLSWQTNFSPAVATLFQIGHSTSKRLPYSTTLPSEQFNHHLTITNTLLYTEYQLISCIQFTSTSCTEKYSSNPHFTILTISWQIRLTLALTTIPQTTS